MVRGWRLLFFAAVMIFVSLFLNSYAEPAIYSFFPPTPTETLTPTITTTPTITETPTITLTPSITPTPEVTDTPTTTSTPRVPLAIEMEFTSVVTPNPDAVFSPIIFTRALNDDYEPIDPAVVFTNPIERLLAYFSYNNMTEGVQWTSLWFREGTLVHYETKPWDGAVGGYGYTDWSPDPSEWLPGEYQVDIFVGLNWVRSGQFIVEGTPPTPAPSLSPTSTETSPSTATSTRTPVPTLTDTTTRTVPPTPTITLTPTITNTRVPSATLSPTITRWPSPTRTITPTSTSTRTPRPTATP
jgi:hypothetical protein